ncbi:hypothetical protein PV08_08235 [Exophiala spinifera]|uniref:Zn(2)-C6 fungal-type domain-containing protein n=1 Tax=Exophiala spinifera TaxID=91928 RepID=A0A0D2B2D9_9EURO|nr:uncharacterized protein PV08_08235 [Exophiala spinifera]KIW13048.1 hypothetical protein PV08_08235 [Exophiala spinifera]
MSSLKLNAEKTRRVAIACSACQQKRVRCEGTEPSCRRCIENGITCEYQYRENKRKPPSKRFVESLQARIKVLESQLSLLGKDTYDLLLNDDGHIPGDEAEGMGETDESDDQSALSPMHDFVRELAHTYGSLTLDDNGQLRYFGPQSNFNLLHSYMDHRDRQSVHDVQDHGVPSRTWVTPEIQIPLELQEHLLDLYFCWQNPWLYLIEKEIFLRDFRSTDRTRYCTPVLLLAIFSVAARYSDRTEIRANPADPNTAGDEFAQATKTLLMIDCEKPTVTTVQAAALLALRWIAENNEPAGWLYTGMATRIAYNLGLNVDSDKWLKSGLITEEDAEVRKVAWYGCWTLDKLFCLHLGRSGTVPDRDVTCCKPSLSNSAEFEPWSSGQSGPGELFGAHARIASTAHYMTDHLSLVLHALDLIYAPNSKLSGAEVDALVSKTDLATNTFWSTLPSYLRLPSSSRTRALPHIYQLHIQYHVAQILLHRPFIAKNQAKPRSSKLVLDVDNIHLKLCRDSASEIVRLLRVYKHHYSLRLVPVGTVSHTFTAAIIHLMDATSGDPTIQKQGNAKLRFRISALQEMETAWFWSFRARRAIQILASAWLTKAPASPLSASTGRSQAKISAVTESAATAQPPYDISPHSDPGAGTMPVGFPATFSAFEQQSSNGSVPELSADDLNWIFNVDAATNGAFDGLGDWQSLNETDMWLSMAAQSTFATTNMETYPYSPNVEGSTGG